MHNGCSGAYESGKEIVDKIRMMGFNTSSLAVSLKMACTNCEAVFQMETMEAKCPQCQMVYGVTPCHSHNTSFVKAAGVNY